MAAMGRIALNFYAFFIHCRLISATVQLISLIKLAQFWVEFIFHFEHFFCSVEAANFNFNFNFVAN